MIDSSVVRLQPAVRTQQQNKFKNELRHGEPPVPPAGGGGPIFGGLSRRGAG